MAACGGGLYRKVVFASLKGEVKRFLRLTGPLSWKVLKFDAPAGARVMVGASKIKERHYDKTFKTAPLARGENMQTSLRSLENHTTAPLARWKCTPSAYGTSPGGGGFTGTMP